MKQVDQAGVGALRNDSKGLVQTPAGARPAEHLARWIQSSDADGGSLWWIEGDVASPIAHQGWTANELAIAAEHQEWITSAPADSVSVPAPGTLEGWERSGLAPCRLRVALGGPSEGRAVMLLTGAQVASSVDAMPLLQQALREEGATLVRDVEIAYLRARAQQRDLTLAEERKMFLAGKVVVFKWRNAADWPVEYVSPNVAQVLGYDQDAWLNGEIRYAGIVHPEDATRVAEEVTAALDGDVENFTHEDYRIIRNDGTSRWLYDHTSLIRNEQGEVTHFLGYILDVTDRRVAAEERLVLETKMQQAQKLESLGVLTGGLAHDFNNLLVGVLGNADLALSEVPEESDVARYLQSITLASKRAADLVRQMLAYSGKGRFHIETIDLRSIIEEMSHLLEAAISKKILLRRQFSEEAPKIRADATQVRQVVMNLITNASDAIGTRNGVVTVRTGVRHCNAEYLASARVQGACQPGEYAFLEVTDTGYGMDRETQDRIFDPFYSTKFAGRGLGLAAVQGIVRGHDGALFLKSARGGGTTFNLYFPLETAEATTTDEAVAEGSSGRAVLLVDDEETVRGVAKKMLEKMGLEVVIARDGSEALDIFRADPMRFDMVLLDLTMPNMGGEECLRELRLLRPDLRTVLSSGYTEPESITQLGREGRTGFLQKPYDLEQLEAEVAAMLQSP